MEITRNDIMAYVKTLPVSPQIKGRFKVYVLEKFQTVTQFLTASDAELKKLRNYGKSMKMVVEKVKEEFWKREHDENERVLFDKRVQDTVDKLGAEYDKMFAALNPVFTLPELQGIVSMMQLMNLDEIDLRMLRKFLDSVKVRKDEQGKGAGHAA